MQACLEFPSASAADFGFLDGDLLRTAVDTSSAANTDQKIFAATRSGGDQPETGSTSKMEWTAVETEIRDVFVKLSNVKRSVIGLQTTIFRLGLDSISAVQIAAQLRQKGRKISPMDVLEVQLEAFVRDLHN